MKVKIVKVHRSSWYYGFIGQEIEVHPHLEKYKQYELTSEAFALYRWAVKIRGLCSLMISEKHCEIVNLR